MPSSCSRIATLSGSRSDSGSVVRFQNGPLLEQHVSLLAHPMPCCCGLCSLHCCGPTAPRGLKFFFANHSQAHFLVNFLNLDRTQDGWLLCNLGPLIISPISCTSRLPKYNSVLE